MKILGVSAYIVLISLIITVAVITVTMASAPERRYHCEPQTTVVSQTHWS